MSQDKPTYDLSIISANYNNGRYLSTFIRSIIDSPVWPAELILVNDGSTDQSIEILAGFKDVTFLHVIDLKQNIGLSAALNLALEAATGKYIMRADPDDIFLPQRIPLQIAYLEAHPDIDILGSNVEYFSDLDGRILNTSHFPLDHDAIVDRYRRGKHGLQHPTVCIKGDVYRQFRYTPGLAPTEDYDLFSRMALAGYRFANLPQPLYRMRVHTGSSTSNITFHQISQTFDYRDLLWGTHTSRLQRWRYFKHIQHYRKFQLATDYPARILHLLLATAFYPSKLINRLKLW